jgi:formylglycine-generating enzyme required for sulfatase activity
VQVEIATAPESEALTKVISTMTSTKAPTRTKTVPSPRATKTSAPTPTEAEAGTVKISEIDGMEMVYIPAGIFTMGSNDSENEQPVHEVYLDGFWIDKYEVTNAQYAACVAEGECGDPCYASDLTDTAISDHPVRCVSWYQARAYCGWADRRLLNEAEWEKAARGTDGRLYPWGNQAPTPFLANYYKHVGGTTAVGSYPAGASPYGVLDMAGNVREWVWDYYDEDYYSQSPEKNPFGPSSGGYRVLRGGDWETWLIGSTNRRRGDPAPRDIYTGFRCASWY